MVAGLDTGERARGCARWTDQVNEWCPRQIGMSNVPETRRTDLNDGDGDGQYQRNARMTDSAGDVFLIGVAQGLEQLAKRSAHFESNEDRFVDQQFQQRTSSWPPEL